MAGVPAIYPHGSKAAKRRPLNAVAEQRDLGAPRGAAGAVCRHANAAGTAQLTESTSTRQSSGACGHETADAWGAIIAYPAAGWRVIVCRDRLQWILQRRKNGGAERPWRAVGYCQTREALVRLCAASCGPVDPFAAAILASLPETIGKGGAA